MYPQHVDVVYSGGAQVGVWVKFPFNVGDGKSQLNDGGTVYVSQIVVGVIQIDGVAQHSSHS